MLYIDDGVVVEPRSSRLQRPSPMAYTCAWTSAFLWWPSARPSEVQASYSPAVHQEYNVGTRVMQAPIDADDYIRQVLLEKAIALMLLLSFVDELKDVYVALIPFPRVCVCLPDTYLRPHAPSHRLRSSTRASRRAFDGSRAAFSRQTRVGQTDFRHWAPVRRRHCLRGIAFLAVRLTPENSGKYQYILFKNL